MRTFAALLLAVSILAARAAAGDAIAVTFDGRIFRLPGGSAANPHLFNATGFTALNALAKDPFGRYIASSGGNASLPAKLIEIDVATGLATLLTTMPINGDIRGLAFDVDGSILAVVRASASTLVRVQADGSSFSVLGATGLTNVQDLAVSPAGVIFGWDAGTATTPGLGLVRLSRQSGAATDVNATNGGDSSIQALTFDHLGNLVGLRNASFQISQTSGLATQNAGTTTNDFRGFAFEDAMTSFDGALGVDFVGSAFRVNTSTGAVAPLGTAAPGLIMALARNPVTGEILAGASSVDAKLFAIDPTSGAFTLRSTAPIHNLTGLTFDASGFLYAVSSAPFSDEFWIVQPTTGQVALIGTTGLHQLRALATSPGDVIYGWDGQFGLVTIDRSTGQAQDVDPQFNANQLIEAIAFDRRGRLIGANDSNGAQSLFEIDLITGTPTPYGLTPIGDLRGIEFFAGHAFDLPSTYCTAQTNSSGCVPQIGSSGPNVPSASLGSGFTIAATNVLGGQHGLLFYGLAGRLSAPFGGGTMCVASPRKRTPLITANGSSTGCAGTFDFDFNAFVATGVDVALVGGVYVDAQFWSRDPAAPSTTNLTDALEFQLAP